MSDKDRQTDGGRLVALYLWNEPAKFNASFAGHIDHTISAARVEERRRYDDLLSACADVLKMLDMEAASNGCDGCDPDNEGAEIYSELATKLRGALKTARGA